jgi:hypothetical protein
VVAVEPGDAEPLLKAGYVPLAEEQAWAASCRECGPAAAAKPARRPKKGYSDEPLPAVPPERGAANLAHAARDRQGDPHARGAGKDELLRQRRAEIVAIRRDLDALVRDVRKLSEELPGLVMGELRSELKKTVPTSRAYQRAITAAGNGRAGVRRAAMPQVHHQVSVMRNQAAGSGRVGQNSKQCESRRDGFRLPKRLSVKNNMHRTFFNVRWWG